MPEGKKRRRSVRGGAAAAVATPLRRHRRPLWRIAEPTTTVTDVALAALTAALGVLLLRHGAQWQDAAVRLWGGAFLATTVSALLGGAVHGFAPWLSERARERLWSTTLVSIGVTNFLLLAAVVVAELEGAARGALLAFTILKLLVYLGLLRTRSDFAVAAVDSGVALLGVLVLEVFAGLLGSAAGADWIVAGVLLSLAGAAAQIRGWSLHRHFNHNDLFHVVQMGAAYLLFRGGLLL